MRCLGVALPVCFSWMCKFEILLLTVRPIDAFYGNTRISYILRLAEYSHLVSHGMAPESHSAWLIIGYGENCNVPFGKRSSPAESVQELFCRLRACSLPPNAMEQTTLHLSLCVYLHPKWGIKWISKGLGSIRDDGPSLPQADKLQSCKFCTDHSALKSPYQRLGGLEIACRVNFKRSCI